MKEGVPSETDDPEQSQGEESLTPGDALGQQEKGNQSESGGLGIPKGPGAGNISGQVTPDEPETAGAAVHQERCGPMEE